MERAHEAGNLEDYHRWDRVFHTTLYEAAGRPVLNRQIAALLASSVRYQRYQTARLLEPGGMRTSLNAHRAIWEAGMRSDARLVKDLIRGHLEEAAERAVRSLAVAEAIASKNGVGERAVAAG